MKAQDIKALADEKFQQFKRHRFYRFFVWGGAALGTLLLLGVVILTLILHAYSRDLPDYKKLTVYNPPIVSRIYAGNGQLLTEYSKEKRIFVPIDAIPDRVIHAFISSEDQNYYTHPGVDFVGVIRATIQNILNIGTNRRMIGASTITQQVAKNFLLTNEVSLERKIKEAILAFRIERAFSKKKILELYLNEIYLGGGTYGVAAAALYYFDKTLDELTIAEAAYLGALPKAPNNYNPVRNYDAAVNRRNYVLERMYEDHWITRADMSEAIIQPLLTKTGVQNKFLDADYFAEEVRRRVIDMYSTHDMYNEGLYIKSTVSPRLQKIANKVLRQGLVAYDRRHGWRGALGQMVVDDTWPAQIKAFPAPKGLEDWHVAVVLKLLEDSAEIGLPDGGTGYIPLSEIKWARTRLKDGGIGSAIKVPADRLHIGDVIAVEKLTQNKGSNIYALRQIPAVNGAIVALDPHTGRVLAMTGGFDYKASEFNRATQAKRQPGSAIKPFVYLAALQNGFTPATMILDAPIVINRGPGQPKWKPSNYTKQFYGPSPMRIGIEKSRNLMTVRLAQAVGMRPVAETIEKFGISKDVERNLSVALGSGETTLLALTTAYGMLVNGGKRITPALIDRIQDRRGAIIYRHDTRACEGCQGAAADARHMPILPDEREQIVSPQAAYQIVSMLEGVVKRGTGRRVRAVGKPLAGKTGTTNDSKDTWFMGFSPDLVAGVYVGFDTPVTLGKGETGSSVTAPIFRDFMKGALKGVAATPFRIPSGIRLVRVNAKTGRLARPGDKTVILEAFRPGTEPTDDMEVIEGLGTSLPTSGNGGGFSTELEGIY